MKSDSQNYEVHILTHALSDNSTRLLVFFAVTIQEFNKFGQSAGSLLQDLKNGVLDSVEEEQLWTLKSVNKHLIPLFTSLHRQYGSSSLKSVSQKVNSVRDLMQNSVNKALNSVEKLEEMDEKSEVSSHAIGVLLIEVA